MTKIQYIPYEPTPKTLALIWEAEKIINQYAADGFSLTLRQLYYRLVAANVIPNTPKSYKRVGDIMSKARDGGLISWDALEDRTRPIRGVSTFGDASDVIDAALYSFKLDHWQGQKFNPLVIVEKEALLDVIAQASRPLQADYMAAKGFLSSSVAWQLGQKIKRLKRIGIQLLVIYAGDFDPSGLFMAENDVPDRLGLYSDYTDYVVEHVALTESQIIEYAPPPNPAKQTDSRFDRFADEHGFNSYELDALPPQDLVEIIQSKILSYRDDSIFQEVKAEEDRQRAILQALVDNWSQTEDFITDNYLNDEDSE